MTGEIDDAAGSDDPEPAQAPSPRSRARKANAQAAGTHMASQAGYFTVRAAFERFRAAEPEPRGELEHRNAFTLLVAVALSAQATDAGVNKATRRLFDAAETPEAMLALGEAGVIEHIRTIGLFRNKARNVIKLSRRLVEDFGGEVPASRAALQSLPGVGRKTANVVLNMWWASSEYWSFTMRSSLSIFQKALKVLFLLFDQIR